MRLLKESEDKTMIYEKEREMNLTVNEQRDGFVQKQLEKA